MCCLVAVSLSAELREQPDKKEIPPQVQDQKNEIPARKEEQKPEKKESRNLPRSRFHHKRKSRNLRRRRFEHERKSRKRFQHEKGRAET